MKEVKISFNKQTFNENGYHYKGCFTVSESLYTDFKAYALRHLERYKNKTSFSGIEMNELIYLPKLEIEVDEYTGNRKVFLTLTQKSTFVRFLKEKGIKFNHKRTCGEFNYYLAFK